MTKFCTKYLNRISLRRQANQTFLGEKLCHLLMIFFLVMQNGIAYEKGVSKFSQKLKITSSKLIWTKLRSLFNALVHLELK
jgi:hypothetical protein